MPSKGFFRVPVSARGKCFSQRDSALSSASREIGFMVKNVGFMLLFFLVSANLCTFVPETQQYKHTQ